MKNKFNLSAKKKIIIAISVFALLIILAVWGWISSLDDGTVEITLAPKTAKVFFNGKEFKRGKNKINPGKYKVRVEAPDFIQRDVEFEISANEEKRFAIALEHSSGTTEYYLKNRDDDILRSAVGSVEFNEMVERNNKKYPILKHLPFDDPTAHIRYSIQPIFEKENLQKILITVNDYCQENNRELYKKAALNHLKQFDADFEKNYKFEIRHNCENGKYL